MAEPRHQLSSVTRELLWKGVSSAFDDAHDAPWPTALEIADSIHACVRSHVSDLLVRHNARHSLQRRLPDELWCNVWDWLPHLDLARILRVCRAWRKLALATPSLWSRILCYSAVHKDRCICRECLGEGRVMYEYPPGWFESPYTSRAWNVSTIPKLLELGRHGTVHLSVDIVPYRPAVQVLQCLADALERHVARLVSIRFRSCDPAAFREFLSRAKCLPSLRTVTLDWLPDDPRTLESAASRISETIPPGVELPKLEYLRMDNGHFCWQYENHVHLPALRSLSFYPRSVAQITAVLTACPQLNTLTASLGSIYGRGLLDTMDVVQKLRASVDASLLAAVELHGFDNQERWAISVFQHCAALSLGYHSISECELGYGIFDALRGPVHVSLQRTADGECIDATDAAGTKRQISSARGAILALPRIVESITPDKINRLSVDVTLWAELVAHLPRGLPVSSLVFTVRSSSGLTAPMPDSVDPALFPALETVSIHSPPGHDPAVTLDDITVFLRRSGLALPLAHVSVSTRFASRGQCLPLEVALRTTIARTLRGGTLANSLRTVSPFEHS